MSTEQWPHKNIFESDYYEDTLVSNINARKEDPNDLTSLYNTSGRQTGDGSLEMELEPVEDGTTTFTDSNSAWGPIQIDVKRG